MEILIGIVIGSLLPLVLHIVNITAGFYVRRRLTNDIKRRSRGILALTYDDGPGDRLQRGILKLLKKHDAKATFFLLGLRVAGCKKQIDEITDAGHEIGTHAFSHLNAALVDPITIFRDFRLAEHAFRAEGEQPKVYRPPYGRLTLSNWWQARRARVALVFWTHDGGDTARELSAISSVRKAVDRAGGGVVLLHSHDRSASGTSREEYVLRVTEDLLQLAKERDFRVVTCSEVLQT